MADQKAMLKSELEKALATLLQLRKDLTALHDQATGQTQSDIRSVSGRLIQAEWGLADSIEHLKPAPPVEYIYQEPNITDCCAGCGHGDCAGDCPEVLRMAKNIWDKLDAEMEA
jgi:hypothetical protein